MSEIDDNPFRPPYSDWGFLDGSPLNLTNSGPIRVDGKFLVVKSGAVLPKFCVKTNVPVPEANWRKSTFMWCPPYVFAFILLGGFAVILAYFFARKRFSFTFGISNETKAKYRKRLYVKLLITLALLIAVPVTANIDDSVCIVVMILLLIAFVSLFIGNSPVSIHKHRNGEFWVAGCSREFLSRFSDDVILATKVPSF